MKQHRKWKLTALLTVLCCLLLCLGLGACSIGPADDDKEKNPPITTPTLYTVTVAEYDKAQGTVALTPEKADGKYEKDSTVTVTVTAKETYEVATFTVSTDAQAALNSEGKYSLKVTADTTITATFQKAVVAVESVTLNKEALTVHVTKEDATLEATVLPADATVKTVTWTSSAPTIATVDQNGKVTAVAAGEAKITATSGEKTATCTVTVTGHTLTNVSKGESGHAEQCTVEGCGYESETVTAHSLKINEAKTAFECEDCSYSAPHTHSLKLQNAGAEGHKNVCETEGCGYESAVTAHSAKDETWLQDEAAGKHYKLCVCGARVDEAEHTERTLAAVAATCTQKGKTQGADCSVCGKVLTEQTETDMLPHKAAENAEWQKDPQKGTHYKLCATCGEAHVDEAEHAPEDEEEWLHDEGDDKTGKHWQVCVCGEKVNEGTHEMDPEAFSDGAAGHHYECEQCGFKTETEAHVNESGKWTKHSDFNKGHYYRCSICETEVTQRHTIEYYSDENGLSRRCNGCDFDAFVSAHEMTKLVSDGAGTEKHHFECTAPIHENHGCTYKTESVSCANNQYMTWTQDAGNPASGHVGTCQCGNQVSVQSHDTLGEDGKCSKCGYKESDEHVCVDNAVNGYYDGVCDICTKNFNNTWNFDAATGTILKYAGTYEKIRVPVWIDNKEVKIIKAATSGSDTGFTKNTTIKAIMIPEDSLVETLPQSMFAQCSNLESISILSSKITSIPMIFASMCKQLKWIVLPATVTTVNSNSFLQCTALTAVYFLGDSSAWNGVTVNDSTLRTKTILFYNANSGAENAWHWDTDKVTPKPWKEAALSATSIALPVGRKED